MALRPSAGRAVWARRPRRLDAYPQGALAPRLDHAAGRLGEDGGVGGQQVGADLEETSHAVVPLVDLLAGIEAPGDVDGRCSRVVARWRRTASPPFMSAAPTP